MLHQDHICSPPAVTRPENDGLIWVVGLFPDPEVQGYAIIPQITGKIIDVIPDGVLVNDDDFVDVYYTLMQNTPYVDRPGAGGNAVASFAPVTISPTE